MYLNTRWVAFTASSCCYVVLCCFSLFWPFFELQNILVIHNLHQCFSWQWVWVSKDNIFIFEWTFPLKLNVIWPCLILSQQYRSTTLPAFKYYVTCACLIFSCIFIVQILVLPKWVCIPSKNLHSILHLMKKNTSNLSCLSGYLSKFEDFFYGFFFLPHFFFFQAFAQKWKRASANSNFKMAASWFEKAIWHQLSHQQEHAEMKEARELEAEC